MAAGLPQVLDLLGLGNPATSYSHGWSTVTKEYHPRTLIPRVPVANSFNAVGGQPTTSAPSEDMLGLGALLGMGEPTAAASSAPAAISVSPTMAAEKAPEMSQPANNAAAPPSSAPATTSMPQIDIIGGVATLLGWTNPTAPATSSGAAPAQTGAPMQDSSAPPPSSGNGEPVERPVADSKQAPGSASDAQQGPPDDQPQPQQMDAFELVATVLGMGDHTVHNDPTAISTIGVPRESATPAGPPTRRQEGPPHGGDEGGIPEPPPVFQEAAATAAAVPPVDFFGSLGVLLNPEGAPVEPDSKPENFFDPSGRPQPGGKDIGAPQEETAPPHDESAPSQGPPHDESAQGPPHDESSQAPSHDESAQAPPQQQGPPSFADGAKGAPKDFTTAPKNPHEPPHKRDQRDAAPSPSNAYEVLSAADYSTLSASPSKYTPPASYNGTNHTVENPKTITITVVPIYTSQAPAQHSWSMANATTTSGVATYSSRPSSGVNTTRPTTVPTGESASYRVMLSSVAIGMIVSVMCLL